MESSSSRPITRVPYRHRKHSPPMSLAVDRTFSSAFKSARRWWTRVVSAMHYQIYFLLN